MHPMADQELADMVWEAWAIGQISDVVAYLAWTGTCVTCRQRKDLELNYRGQTRPSLA
jgi:hypothetical protein